MTEAERIANDIVAAWKQEPADDRGLDPLREAIAAAIGSAGEAIPVSPTPDWQDISTAPERRKVMVTWVNALGKRRTTFATYWPAGTLDMAEDADEWGDEEGKNEQAGWWEESEANDDAMYQLIEPLTHWMPIPDPPASPSAVLSPQQEEKDG